MSTSIAAPRRHNATEKKTPGNACEPIAWSVPRAEDEARALLTCMQRTNATLEEMIGLICVSDREYLELCEWAADNPPIAGQIDSMMAFRQRVLLHFQALVAKASQQARQQAGCQSSSDMLYY